MRVRLPLEMGQTRHTRKTWAAVSTRVSVLYSTHQQRAKQYELRMLRSPMKHAAAAPITTPQDKR